MVISRYCYVDFKRYKIYLHLSFLRSKWCTGNNINVFEVSKCVNDISLLRYRFIIVLLDQDSWEYKHNSILTKLKTKHNYIV